MMSSGLEETPKLSFDSLGIDPDLQAILQAQGIHHPSKAQHGVIRSMLDSDDVLLQSKSGTGKTISFCIGIAQQMINIHAKQHEVRKVVQDPSQHVNGHTVDHIPVDARSDRSDGTDTCEENEAEEMSFALKQAKKGSKKLADNAKGVDGGITGTSVEKRYTPFGEVVIMSPTRELAMQIHDTLSKFSVLVPAMSVYLSVGGKNLAKDISNMLSLAPRILVVTPGRIRTLFKQIKRRSNTRPDGTILHWNTRLLVLDEADMLLDEHFMDQTVVICTKLVNPFVQVVAVSATFQKFQLKVYEDMMGAFDAKFAALCESVLLGDYQEAIHNLRKATSLHVVRRIEAMIAGNGIGKKSTALLGGEMELDEGDSMLKQQDSGSIDVQVAGVDAMGLTTPDMSSPDPFRPVLDYVRNYTRDMRKIIVASSHVNRVDLGAKGFACFIECDDLQDVCTFKQTIGQWNRDTKTTYNSPIVQNISFLYSLVPQAPSIVKQVAMKLKTVLAILKKYKNPRCVIFCNQSHTRLLTASTLRRLGYPCLLLSSRISVDSRIKAIEDASNNGNNIVIAADVISRGIHLENIELVINLDIPPSKEAFLHRAGRTGRYGKPGICVAICTEAEIQSVRYLEYVLNFRFQCITSSLDLDEYDIMDVTDTQSVSTSIGHKGAPVEDIAMVETEQLGYMSQLPESNRADARNGNQINPKVVQEPVKHYDPSAVYNVASFIRDSLMACVMEDLFPHGFYITLNAIGVLASTGCYFPGINKQMAAMAPDRVETNNTLRLRFHTQATKQLKIHLTKKLHEHINSLGDPNISPGDRYQIMVEQEGSEPVELLGSEQKLMVAVPGTMLITIKADVGTCQSLSALFSMDLVEEVVHQENDFSPLSLSVPQAIQDIAALEKCSFFHISESELLKRLKERVADNVHEVKVDSDTITSMFLDKEDIKIPRSLTILYDLVV